MKSERHAYKREYKKEKIKKRRKSRRLEEVTIQLFLLFLIKYYDKELEVYVSSFFINFTE